MKQLSTTPAPASLARRSFLTGLAISLPIATAAATHALAAPGASRSEIDDLYAERTELAARSRELREQYDAADASMPWWARSGHELLRGDGKWTGAVVGWPAIDNDELPSHSTVFFKKRLSPFCIRKRFEEDLRFFGEKQRPEIRATYRRRMRELVARLRRQREEEQKAGLPDLEAQLDAISERVFYLDDRLKNLDVPPAEVLQKAAAVLLIASNYDRHGDDSFGSSATLDALRPLLTGQIREHADYATENPDDDMWSMPFWSAA
jgi:hypothetical protein